MADEKTGYDQFAEWYNKAADEREARKAKEAAEQAEKDAKDKPKGLLAEVFGIK